MGIENYLREEKDEQKHKELTKEAKSKKTMD